MARGGVVVIAIAIIWAAVILASARVLQDTGLFDRLLPILGGGAAASVIVAGAGARRR